jgi:MarR-like DNA-binding transcriptional regulator SgrR of sgrS sRNA
LDFYVAGDYPELTKKYCDYIVKTLRETLNISIRVHYTTMERRINAVESRKAGLWKIAISPDYPDATSLFSLFLSSQPYGIEKNLLLPEVDSKSFSQKLQFAFQQSNNELKNNSLAACDSILMSEKWALPLVYWDNIIIQNLRVRQINISPIGTFDFKNTYIKPL